MAGPFGGTVEAAQEREAQEAGIQLGKNWTGPDNKDGGICWGRGRGRHSVGEKPS